MAVERNPTTAGLGSKETVAVLPTKVSEIVIDREMTSLELPPRSEATIPLPLMDCELPEFVVEPVMDSLMMVVRELRFT